MLARDLMTAPPITCRAADSLETAAGLMWDHDCGSLAVVDATGGLIGMITDRDICMAAYTERRRLDDIPVFRAMAPAAVSCQITDHVSRVEDIMARYQVHRLPVLDRFARVVGVLSIDDLARAGDQDPGSDEGLEPERITSTLAAVAERRFDDGG